MAINPVNYVMSDLLPKIKLRLLTERNFDQQWRDYILNPTLETPLKDEINTQITEMMLSQIVDEKNKLHEMIVALATLKEQEALLLRPIQETVDPNSTGSLQEVSQGGGVLYFECVMVFIENIVETLLVELSKQITQSTQDDAELTERIDTLEELIDAGIAGVIEEFSNIEGVFLGAHSHFAELIHDFSHRRMEHGIFHGHLTDLIFKLHRDENGVEPHPSIVDSIRNRVLHRVAPMRQMGDERHELLQTREKVRDHLSECRRLQRDVLGLQGAARSCQPGQESALIQTAEALEQRSRPVLKFSVSRKTEEEESKLQWKNK